MSYQRLYLLSKYSASEELYGGTGIAGFIFCTSFYLRFLKYVEDRVTRYIFMQVSTRLVLSRKICRY